MIKACLNSLTVSSVGCGRAGIATVIDGSKAALATLAPLMASSDEVMAARELVPPLALTLTAYKQFACTKIVGPLTNATR